MSQPPDLAPHGAPPAEEAAELPQSSPIQAAQPPETALGKFLLADAPAGGGHHGPTHPWWKVLWLTGMDYFSSLGYAPGISLLAAGSVAPLATLVLVFVTLVGAYPIYAEVASRSFTGQGSIAMLENLIPGWAGKLFVLVLLGFAATDFVITMTLSAADAAQHAVENPLLHGLVGEHKLVVTLVLLALLAAVFIRGFEEAIGVAVGVGIPYVALNLVIIATGAWKLMHEPQHLGEWQSGLEALGSPGHLFGTAVLIFPSLALGMSGFETGVSVMPLVEGGPPPADEDAPPTGRIQATRKLLLAAGVLMGVLLLGSSLVTTLLIPKEAYLAGGKANGRALAYLAHELLGDGFGTAYDLASIAILWFAGASAMAGLLNLIPRYLPRFGMAPRWVVHKRPLILLLFGIDVVVTVLFKADVDAQAGAYATGVLVLMTSAAVAVSLALWHEARPVEGEKRFPARALYFALLTLVFAYTLLKNVAERPDGLYIGSAFILAIVATSAFSRWQRSVELRVERLVFRSGESEKLWSELRGKKVNLVPLKHFTPVMRAAKERQIRANYKVEGPLAFVHVRLADDRSDFGQALRVRIEREGDHFLITVHGALAIANTIAFLSEALDPIAIFLELTRRNRMAQAMRYLLWGEGETGVMVYEILVSYWDWTPENDIRPKIFLLST